LQALVAKIKGEKPIFKKVYSKVLQMVSYQLKSNLNALKEVVGWRMFLYSMRSLQKRLSQGKSFQ